MQSALSGPVTILSSGIKTSFPVVVEFTFKGVCVWRGEGNKSGKLMISAFIKPNMMFWHGEGGSILERLIRGNLFEKGLTKPKPEW